MTVTGELAGCAVVFGPRESDRSLMLFDGDAEGLRLARAVHDDAVGDASAAVWLVGVSEGADGVSCRSLLSSDPLPARVSDAVHAAWGRRARYVEIGEGPPLRAGEPDPAAGVDCWAVVPLGCTDASAVRLCDDEGAAVHLLDAWGNPDDDPQVYTYGSNGMVRPWGGAPQDFPVPDAVRDAVHEAVVLRGRDPGAGPPLKDLRPHVVAEARIAELPARLDALEARMGNDLHSLRQWRTDLMPQLQDGWDKVRALAQTGDARWKMHEELRAHIGDRLSKQDARIAEVAAGIQPLAGTVVNGLQEDVAALKAQVADLTFVTFVVRSIRSVVASQGQSVEKTATAVKDAVSGGKAALFAHGPAHPLLMAFLAAVCAVCAVLAARGGRS